MYIFSFDIWNTLIENKSYKNERIKIINQCLLNHGYSFTNDEVRNSYNELKNLLNAYKMKYKYKFLPINMRIEYITNNLGVPISDSLLKEIVSNLEMPILEDPPKLLIDPYEFNQLASKAYLGFNSDTGFSSGKVIRKILSDQGILVDNIEFQIFSDEVGYNKPDKKMFIPLINNEYNVEASEIYHVGDNWETDAFGAINVGITPVLLRNDNINKCNKENINIKIKNTILDAVKYLASL